jgi:hypothetical protein
VVRDEFAICSLGARLNRTPEATLTYQTGKYAQAAGRAASGRPRSHAGSATAILLHGRWRGWRGVESSSAKGLENKSEMFSVPGDSPIGRIAATDLAAARTTVAAGKEKQPNQGRGRQ